MPRPPGAVLNASEWEVRTVALARAVKIVKRFHYSGGSANTATYRYGLFRKDNPNKCYGVALWIPPTKSAALATYPRDWKGVLCLSRLAINPKAPTNAASFLLGRSMRMIDRKRWPCLVTYADTWQGHTGAIYKATNWEYIGMTRPERTYQINGRMVARKAGPKTRTHAEMLEFGAKLIGSFAKHKFIHVA